MSQDNPNFTIIAPGGCNSKCGFCTDPYNGQWDRDFIPKLQEALITLKPSNFVQCSISGGEPTLSPVFESLLYIARNHFPKTVLTSNGARIMQFKEVIAKTMNHVNISRHAIGYAANVPIFKTKKIIEDGDLKELCSYLNSQGVDVNLNHVYTKEGPQLTKDYVHNYVAYAKMLGANSVSFRYDQSENSLDETYLEAFFKDFKVVNRGGCPVCRNHTILIDGLQVVFKASFVEPSVTIKDVYELIFHIDGRLCTDWGGKDEFTPKKAVEYKIKHNTETLPPLNTNDMFGGLIRPAEERRRVYIQSEPIVEHNYGGGCGSSRGGGCS